MNLYRWLSPGADPYLEQLAAAKQWSGPLSEEQQAQLHLEAELHYLEVLRPIPAPFAARGQIDQFLLNDYPEAWDTNLHRHVMLQFLPLEQARLAARLHHPHIVEILGMGPTYLILEPFTRGAAAPEHVFKLCGAVDYAQREGIQFERIEFGIDRSGAPRLLITKLGRRVDPARHAEGLKQLLPGSSFSSTAPADLAAEIYRRFSSI